MGDVGEQQAKTMTTHFHQQWGSITHQIIDDDDDIHKGSTTYGLYADERCGETDGSGEYHGYLLHQPRHQFVAATYEFIDDDDDFHEGNALAACTPLTTLAKTMVIVTTLANATTIFAANANLSIIRLPPHRTRSSVSRHSMFDCVLHLCIVHVFVLRTISSFLHRRCGGTGLQMNATNQLVFTLGLL